MKQRGLLGHVTLHSADTTKGSAEESLTAERDEWDARALLYVQTRLRAQDKKFREKLDKLIKDNPLKRGPESSDGKPPHAFYQLIRAEKKGFGLKNISETLEFHCKLRGLRTDDDYLTHLHNKYTEGSRKAAKKMR